MARFESLLTAGGIAYGMTYYRDRYASDASQTARIVIDVQIGGYQVSTIVAFFTFVVFDVAAILRVNLFLDVLTHRSDWQNLMVRFQASGFESLRTYVNYEYLTGSPFKILVATIIGAVTGLVGGFFGWIVRRNRERPIPL